MLWVRLIHVDDYESILESGYAHYLNGSKHSSYMYALLPREVEAEAQKMVCSYSSNGLLRILLPTISSTIDSVNQ